MIDVIVQYWVAWLCTITSGGLVLLYKQFKAYKEGLKALLRQNIIHEYNHYMEKGYIPIYAMESLTRVYLAYQALGGNGTGTKLYLELKELPSSPPDHNNDTNKEVRNQCMIEQAQRMQ